MLHAQILHGTSQAIRPKAEWRSALPLEVVEEFTNILLCPVNGRQKHGLGQLARENHHELGVSLEHNSLSGLDVVRMFAAAKE